MSKMVRAGDKCRRPSQPGPPRGARAASLRQKKNEQGPFRFQAVTRIFRNPASPLMRPLARCAGHRDAPRKIFSGTVLKLISVLLSRFPSPKRKEPEEDDM